MTELQQEYQRQRKLGNQARWALRNARIVQQWQTFDGVTVYDFDSAACEDEGTVRLRIVPEDEVYDDSYIDTWDCSVRQKEHVRKELWARIEQDGVCGVIGEFWDGEEWQQADSCWGFVGDDWKNSGYDIDIMSAALDCHNTRLEFTARKIEASRPDMYN